jgi:hypothetical protein
VPDVDIGVTGARDVAGNTQVAGNSTDAFDIDTQNPTVTLITPSPLLIADADVGTGKFTVTVDYSEAMDTLVAPTIAFTPGVSSTLTLNAGSSGWTDSDTYVAVYDVADAGVNVPDVDIGVTGARDVAGNTQVAGNSTDAFDIDTQNPTVTLITPSPLLIADADVGTGKFTVTVDYSEAMDTLVAPTIAFTPGVSSTLTLNAGSSGWTDSDTYVAVYDVADAGVNVPDVDIGVTGARDVAGNTQVAGNSTDAFDIDTQNPTVTIDQAVGQPDPTNSSPINFTVVFSESVADFDSSDVTLSSGTALVTGSGTTYNVAVSGMSEGVLTASIGAGVAHDAAGNGNTASTSTDNQVTYDTTSPTVSLPPYVPDPTSDNTPSYSGTATDAGSCNVVDIEFRVDSGGWTDVDAFTPALSVNFTFTTGTLADGLHTIEVRAQDAAGNWSSLASDTLTVTTVAPPKITGVVPPFGFRNSLAIMVIFGTNFQPGATVSLVKDGTVINASGAWVLPGGRLMICTFNLRGAPLGWYDVRVTNPDGGVGILTHAFYVRNR